MARHREQTRRTHVQKWADYQVSVAPAHTRGHECFIHADSALPFVPRLPLLSVHRGLPYRPVRREGQCGEELATRARLNVLCSDD